MGRAPCCDKANVKKGPWSPEEDAKLKSYIEQHGTGGNWIALPQKIGLKRCGKSCRLRWLNYLRPNIKHGGFSEEEDNIICSLYISIGSRWSIIAAQLPGRTDNDIKNYWNTRLKKKLMGKQRKGKRGRETARRKQNFCEISDSLVAIGQQPLAQLPVLPPTCYLNEEPRFNDHTSIRKLLIKLGGRFSTNEDQIDRENIKLYYPTIVDGPFIQPVYSHPIDLMSNSDQVPLLNATSCTPSMVNEPHFAMVGTDMSTMLPGPSVNLATELERVMYENPQKLQGLEFIYDDILKSTSTVGESMDWGEMNSLVFPASASNNNQGFLQASAMEEFVVDKMRYAGTQW